MPNKLPKFKSKIFLAPMHDTTNSAFRILCKEYGVGLVSTELLSANAISRKNKAVLKLSEFEEINDYTKKYHHRFNSNADNVPIDNHELKNYCKKTLELIQKI